ncbi:hypothetical protein [Bradyrhizobium japonicum]|uniref:hypothetical protein n=1 Tax=Bradyrhizobium japonicum TaxID=375 RepID=UPI000AE64EFE|nr:hypothetical protein [Bradyrhizobium japonicum]
MVNALHEPVNRYNQERVSAHDVRTRLDQANVLARAIGLDVVQAGWGPTVDNYLGLVAEPRILETVREAKGESSARLMDHLKKVDIAKEAESLLDGSGWLQEPVSSIPMRRRWSRRVNQARCPNSAPAMRIGRTPTRRRSATARRG